MKKITRKTDENTNGNADDKTMLVGIGAAEGGADAIVHFFSHVPPHSGMVYIVMLHLLPDQRPLLLTALRSVTVLPVFEVNGETEFVPDSVFLLPADRHLVIKDRTVTITPDVDIEDSRAPVDIFFRKLAEAAGASAVGVLLSGMGANGSMGLKRIKEQGGAVFVQNPREAEYNEMPRNAIATNMVDQVLPVASLPEKIMGYKNSLGSIHITDDANRRPEDQQHALREIFTQLRMRTGHDFSNYKRATLLRRIERRITVRSQPDLVSYAGFLQTHPDEINFLLKDLLISVTNFFRDKKAFDFVEQEVMPALLKDKGAESQLRIWIAGCATGEEAYSIAMLCAERTMNQIDSPKIQLFATDIDEAAIAQARDGLYTLNDAADISPERLRRFFNREGDCYRIRREIREMVLFANHNFIKDPPFSHLHLISCRNVLIYLNQAAQERVMETFHFALDPGGYLFLGSSESADSANDLYTVFSREHHVFRSRRVTPQTYPVPESVPTLRFDSPKQAGAVTETGQRPVERVTFGDLHQRLLEQYAPPSLVVNEEYDIIHLTERAGRYLQIGGGEPSKNLLKLVRPDLSLELRSVLYQAVQRKVSVESRGLKVNFGDHVETVNILVRPAFNDADAVKGFILVLFERVENEDSGQPVVHTNAEPIARQLEDELIRLKAQLRTSNEQHEFHAEELKASNEELQAMNEELRSAAEELETSKEELQSINEELRTVNQELKVKIEETTMASNNLQNLINSVDFATIFLDRSFRVNLFSPAAREIFNLIPADYGRPLSDITSRLTYENINADAEQVLSRLQAIEKEVRTTDDRVFMMRILPYRTSEDRINGVVITFFDITHRKHAEDALRRSEERTRLLVESAKDYAIFTTDTERCVNSWNSGAELMIGYTEEEIMGHTADVFFVPEDRENNAPQEEMRKALEKGSAENERWHSRSDGSRFYGSGMVRPLYDANGGLLGFVKIMRDLTEQKETEYALRQSEERYRIALQSAEMGAWDWNIADGEVVWNDQHFIMLGLTPTQQKLSRDYFLQFVHPADKPIVRQALRSAEEVGMFHAEFRILRADNSQVLWMNGYGKVVETKDQKAIRMVGVMYDITEQKKLEKQKDEFIGIASHELKTPVTSIKAYAELLQENFADSDDASSREIIQKMTQQVDRLADLIKALLDTTKITEEGLQLNMAPVNINQILEERVEVMQLLAPKNRIALKAGEIRNTVADRERIAQVIDNLLSNAIKYSGEGKDITVSSEIAGDSVLVKVQDKGIGMAKEITGNVFQRFFRGDDPVIQSYPGLGLGLYIAAEIIRRHNGQIYAESEQGAGSTFSFTLPLREYA